MMSFHRISSGLLATVPATVPGTETALSDAYAAAFLRELGFTMVPFGTSPGEMTEFLRALDGTYEKVNMTAMKNKEVGYSLHNRSMVLRPGALAVRAPLIASYCSISAAVCQSRLPPFDRERIQLAEWGDTLRLSTKSATRDEPLLMIDVGQSLVVLLVFPRTSPGTIVQDCLQYDIPFAIQDGAVLLGQNNRVPYKSGAMVVTDDGHTHFPLAYTAG